MHLEETSIINVYVFAEGIGSLAQFLDFCCSWATDMLDEKYEFEREMAEYFC